MNFDELDFETPIDVTIVDPRTMKPTDAVIKVHPFGGKTHKDIRVKISRKKLAGCQTEEERNNLEPMSDQEYYEQAIVSWDGVENSEGPIECTPENIRILLDDPRRYFIVEQLNIRCRLGGFDPKPLKDSQSGSDKKHGTKAK